MAIATAVAIYFLIWWIVLFAVLPWGVRSQGDDSPPGTDPGAPTVPRLRSKLIWTTAVTTVVWAICAVAYAEGFITLDGLAALMGLPQLSGAR
jgi:predicted secreted protein